MRRRTYLALAASTLTAGCTDRDHHVDTTTTPPADTTPTHSTTPTTPGLLDTKPHTIELQNKADTEFTVTLSLSYTDEAGDKQVDASSFSLTPGETWTADIDTPDTYEVRVDLDGEPAETTVTIPKDTFDCNDSGHRFIIHANDSIDVTSWSTALACRTTTPER